MNDWNVTVTVHEHGFKDAIRLLKNFGTVSKTDYFNVLVMRVDNSPALLAELSVKIKKEPGILNILARVIPATRTFNFMSPEEFEKKARKATLTWVPDLAGKSFHVRMHRRGFKGRLSTTLEERMLDQVLLDALVAKDTPGASLLKITRPCCWWRPWASEPVSPSGSGKNWNAILFWGLTDRAQCWHGNEDTKTKK